MDRIGQNHSRTLKFTQKRPQEFGVMDWHHMQAFLAPSIAPDRDPGIGKTRSIWHQEQQAVGTRTGPVARHPQPCDQQHES